MITVYSNRIEILSRGTIASVQTIEELYLGESVPVNEKLSKIFAQLRISDTAIDNNIRYLKNDGYLERICSNKEGYWKVIDQFDEIDICLKTCCLEPFFLIIFYIYRRTRRIKKWKI